MSTPSKFRLRAWIGAGPIAVLTAACFALSCSKREEASPAAAQPNPGELLRVGSVVVHQSDLVHHLREHHDGRDDAETRARALDELARRAQFAQAALDAGLDRDPVIRAEMARLLAARLREVQLNPELEELAAPISEARLRELYTAQAARFAANEKRQLAVLWLDPGQNPERRKAYEEKLAGARDWFFNESDLAAQPEKGFSVLSVDHSEHAASRFKGGVLGWIEAESGATDWDRAVAEIAASLGKAGDVSPVVTRPEGVFLVRLMAVKPAVQRTFESVRAELERRERQRLRELLEAEFRERIRSSYAVGGN